MKKVAVIGTGVIGNGWITRFLANGCEVVAHDPAPGAKERTIQAIENAWESVEQLGLKEGASKDSLTFVDSIEEAVKDADLIQESVPERYELKHGVLKEIDRFAHSNTIIGSSTSGIKPTDLQIGLNHPERLVVAHPFNPVYLLPLVEIVGGEATTKEITNRASVYYESLQMKPMVIEKEIEGFVADRLMEALWREALHLVNDGIATTEEVDKAITYGAGLRWAQMGPFMTFHLAGGNAGMRHMLEQFGPALKLPWTKLEAPELTDELKERVIQGCETHANDRSVEELEKKRNEFLVKLIDLVEDYWP
ncbi:3-hydroxyacyl-CoA dehydrogenase NAD-binding domain-containing protein [Oceanobacillus iheyensis]|uniref:L-carnitine dehydrogenase n=1 Tax=Oceanobacillus iheyensis (strain DSM 14371 / CIP 107618 / JCM 11309 / KCTC 3954 / HTE831) TaxID=221109 RepID=LCDH_OCEIH|nr:3-hydroxyacyl-CoA dehydrogenase NAD-binding domain-containing protein [Oceanobacillus iheyensis]Q8CUW0.1 RecName: Full=L-carnitine dehydrogenase; Short=CDH; Short=L-CDH [Oceanobacillus iheyensis HTE831]BAC12953.1 3-hydroxyacyl-CoA dehydrogenase [Oceanobacillus iheyensis HTE831]